MASLPSRCSCNSCGMALLSLLLVAACCQTTLVEAQDCPLRGECVRVLSLRGSPTAADFHRLSYRHRSRDVTAKDSGTASLRVVRREATRKRTWRLGSRVLSRVQAWRQTRSRARGPVRASGSEGIDFPRRDGCCLVSTVGCSRSESWRARCQLVDPSGRLDCLRRSLQGKVNACIA